jgi:hypothetical protein
MILMDFEKFKELLLSQFEASVHDRIQPIPKDFITNFTVREILKNEFKKAICSVPDICNMISCKTLPRAAVFSKEFANEEGIGEAR